MDFSFGVMTYNSSDYVLETLESIKYQVLNYGKNKKKCIISYSILPNFYFNTLY